MLVPVRVTLFNGAGPENFQKSDTSFIYRPSGGAQSIPLELARRWSFMVYNQLDVTVTYVLLGGDQPDAAALGEIGASDTLAAGAREPIASDLFTPYQSIGLQFATSDPSSGVIFVTAAAQLELPDSADKARAAQLRQTIERGGNWTEALEGVLA